MLDNPATPYSQKTASQKRQYHVAKTKESRERKKLQDTIAEGASCRTREEWWALNRSKMSASELQAALDLHARCLDEVFWIQHGNELSPEDELFVGLDEGVASLIAFIKEHPCPHLGYQTAGDLPPDKGEYWKSAEMLKAIEAEGPATYLYYRTGLLSGVPDWIVWNMLTEEPEHFLSGSDKWTGKPWWPLGNARWTWERAATLTGMTRGPHAGINDDLRYR